MRALPRWKRKLALGCLFAAGAVILLSLSGPHHALLAQQEPGTQPVATPTPFPYGSSLPVCSDEVVNAVLTPPVGPTAIPSIDGPVSNCLWPSTPYPMNTDLGAIGVPGNPGPVSPLPQPATTPAPVIEAPLFPTPTPIAQAAFEGAPETTSKPILLRQPQLYLPLLQNGADLSTMAAERSAAALPAATPVPDDFWSNLPICPDYSLTPSVEPTAAFNVDARPTCRLSPNNQVYIDLLPYYEQGYDLSAMGFPGDPPGPAPVILLTPVAQGASEVVSQTTNALAPQGQPQLYLPMLQR